MEPSWQLRLVKKSLKKREKLSILNKHLFIEKDSINLDLGCAQGILSYFLRRKGGRWWSADLDTVNLEASRDLIIDQLLQIEPGILPFLSQSLDSVVSLDYLEHLDDDDLCLSEIFRILKPGGKIVLAVPRTGRGFLLHKLRPLLGMKLEFYGHKREGYSWKTMKTMLEKSGFEILNKHRFSGFLTELFELILNLVYTRFYSPQNPSAQRDGHIRPTTQAEFVGKKKAFKMYSAVYPLVWLISRLDKAFFFQRGYGLMVWAVKPTPQTGEPGDGIA